MNDGKCDPAGRFLAGTAARAAGGAALYRLDTDGRVTTLIENVTLSNGLGWSPDGALMYYVDTAAETVDVMDYDLSTGTVRDRRIFVNLRDVRGRPDGLTVDADGGVWIAMARGGTVRRYSPAGRLDHVIDMPVQRVTSVAFGGTDLADLYVTTSRDGLTESDLAIEPQAGAVFCVQAVGATGQQPNEYAG
jgi:sugar lactone lactonase YvrE